MMKIFVLLMIIYCVWGSKLIKPIYRDDYKYLSDLDAFYKYHRVKMNFSEAVSLCVAEGAELFMPLSKDETGKVLEIVDKTESAIWLGMHDIYSEGNFIKLDGTPVENSYTNWAYGEPNNNHDQEDCGVMWIKYATFNDGTCFTKAPFVCKRTAQDLEQNTICETYDLDYVYSIDVDACYKLHTQARSWMEAFAVCKAEESEMAIVDGEDEAKFLTKHIFANKFAENMDNYHVGFNDLLIEGVYLTIQGKPLSESSYQKWAPGQPNNQNGSARCGSLQRNGFLNVVDCQKKSMFFCEKRLTNNGEEPFEVFINPDHRTEGTVVELPDA